MNSVVPQVSPCVTEADIEDTTDAALKPISRRERGWGEGTSRRGLSIVSFGEGRHAAGNRIFGATDIAYGASSRHIPVMAIAAKRRAVAMCWSVPTRMSILLLAELGCK
ncbi:hypothetical protein Xcc1_23270 [Xanthomonas campestris pv. campestris]|nr:hypothetical protein Xcc1_23270 [Xanthomonas campestris pv. campestris]